MFRWCLNKLNIYLCLELQGLIEYSFKLIVYLNWRTRFQRELECCRRCRVDSLNSSSSCDDHCRVSKRSPVNDSNLSKKNNANSDRSRSWPFQARCHETQTPRLRRLLKSPPFSPTPPPPPPPAPLFAVAFSEICIILISPADTN